jgi:hypothetical protein
VEAESGKASRHQRDLTVELLPRQPRILMADDQRVAVPELRRGLAQRLRKRHFEKRYIGSARVAEGHSEPSRCFEYEATV